MLPELWEAMGFECGIPFASGRDAMAAYTRVTGKKFSLPTNICPELEAYSDGKLVPVNPANGLAPIAVQLYGYRQRIQCEIELDPQLTGLFAPRTARHSIVSFGRHKTISLGGGGAIFTNDRALEKELSLSSFFPVPARENLVGEWASLFERLKERWRQVGWWDRHLGDTLTRISAEQIIPWRVMRRSPDFLRDKIVTNLRRQGFDVGTNYPPLPGVTDPGAIQWGKEVLNLFVTEDYDEPRIIRACDVIKRTMDA